MAAITTQRNGDWSNTTEGVSPWTGNVAPTEGDTVTISHVVTIDDSAPATIVVGTDTTTAAIAIASGGELRYLSTAAADHVLELRGDLTVATGGSLTIGTALNPIPSTRKFTFELNKDGAAVDYGIDVNGGTVTLQGASKTYDRAYLYSNAAANATTLSLDVDTAWADNDEIGVASTTRTYTQCEKGRVNGAPSDHTGPPYDISVDGFAGTGGGLANAHSGGTGHEKAEVVNLTRNVVVTADNTSYVSFISFDATSIADIDWVEFSYIGNDVSNKRGLDMITTTGSVSVNRCSFHDTPSRTIHTGGSAVDNVSITNCVGYGLSLSVSTTAVYFSATSVSDGLVCTGNCFMYTAGGSGSYIFDLRDAGITFNNNTVAGSRDRGVYISEASGTWLIEDCIAHSNNGLSFDVAGTNLVIYNDCVSYFGNPNFYIGANRTKVTYNNCVAFGGNGYNWYTGGSATIELYNCQGDSHATLTTGENFRLDNQRATLKIVNCTFDSVVATAEFIECGQTYRDHQVTVINSTLNPTTTVINNSSYLYPGGVVAFKDYNGVAGRFVTYSNGGGMIRDLITGGFSATYGRGGSGQAVCLLGNHASYPVEWTFCIPVTAATSTTLSAYISKSNASFSGTVHIDVYDSDDYLTKLVDTTLTNDDINVNDGDGDADDWSYQWSSGAFTPSQTGFCKVVISVTSTSAHTILVDDVGVA